MESLFLDARQKDLILRQLVLVGMRHRDVTLLREIDALVDRSGWATVPRYVLAARCGCSEATVWRAVKRLQEMGLVELKKNTGRESQYRVAWSKLRTLPRQWGCAQNERTPQQDRAQNERGCAHFERGGAQNERGPKKASPRTKLNTSSKYTPPPPPSLKPEVENLKPELTSPPEEGDGGDGGRYERQRLGATAPALEPTAGAQAPQEIGSAARQGREPLAAAVAIEEASGCHSTPEPAKGPETAAEALSAQAAGRKPQADPPTWSDATRALYEAGVAQAHDATARAREHGCQPTEVLALVSHYLRHRGCWSPGQLFVRIVQHVPGACPESNWPTPRRPLRPAGPGAVGSYRSGAGKNGRCGSTAEERLSRPAGPGAAGSFRSGAGNAAEQAPADARQVEPPAARLRRFPRERIQEALARLPPHLRPLWQRRGLASELVAAWLVGELEKGKPPDKDAGRRAHGASRTPPAAPQDPRPRTQDPQDQEGPSHEKATVQAVAATGAVRPTAGPGD